MKITNLKESPLLKEQTIDLIEKSFGYESENSFEIDFYPLINEKNHSHCHLLVDGETVVAHIGALSRKISLEKKDYTFTMFGGIAVNEDYRGKGHFSELFNSVLARYKESCFHLLWSDKLDLYEKFNFHPCIELNQYEQKNNNESYPQLYEVEQTYLIDLAQEDLEQIKKLYTKSHELRVERNDSDWDDLKSITSSQLYLVYSNDGLVNYFFKDKGQDLTQIIHEYGYIDKEQLELMQNFGIVWSPQVFPDNGPLYASLLRIQNEELFKSLVQNYSPIKVSKIKENIEFEFENNNYRLTQAEFLQGLFGPSRFEEISTPYFFVSGLDSI